MKALAPFDVVQVGFPFVETARQRVRPAVVVTTAAFHQSGVAWCLMITSARQRPWPGDVVIEDLTAAGLVKPCVVRTAKIATIPTAAARPLGFLDEGTRREVGVLVTTSLEAMRRWP